MQMKTHNIIIVYCAFFIYTDVYYPHGKSYALPLHFNSEYNAESQQTMTSYFIFVPFEKATLPYEVWSITTRNRDNPYHAATLVAVLYGCSYLVIGSGMRHFPTIVHSACRVRDEGREYSIIPSSNNNMR